VTGRHPKTLNVCGHSGRRRRNAPSRLVGSDPKKYYLERNKMVQGQICNKTLPRRKLESILRALIGRIDGSQLSPKKRSGGSFIPGGSAAPAGG
jgi:hypothetical protein